jgi:hypothetical protein
MGPDVKNILNAFGVLAETSAILRDQLMKNGFTRAEAIEMVSTYIATSVASAQRGN